MKRKLELFPFWLLLTLTAHCQDIRVTATELSSATTRSMFGPLAKQYGSAAVVVCNNSAASVSLPLASVLQQGAIPAGVTVLPSIAALQVIARAQGATKTATAFRIGIAVVEGAAVATSLSGISATLKNALTDTALLGGQLIPIISAAATTNALVNYSQATLPDPIQLVAGGCSPPAIVLTEKDSGARKADFRMAK